MAILWLWFSCLIPCYQIPSLSLRFGVYLIFLGLYDFSPVSILNMCMFIGVVRLNGRDIAALCSAHIISEVFIYSLHRV